MPDRFQLQHSSKLLISKAILDIDLNAPVEFRFMRQKALASILPPRRQ